MKKIFSLFLVLMMFFTFATAALAAGEDEGTQTGTITINGVDSTKSYAVYRLLDLESFNDSQNAYAYRVNSAWSGFFATAEALSYVTIDATGYVTWKEGVADSAVYDFADAALAYAKANNIQPVKSSATEGDFVITGTTGVFSGLDLGYYLVDSTMTLLCGLTGTTKPGVEITAKVSPPIMDKLVQEDSLVAATDKGWSHANTADIGQVVDYEVTIDVYGAAENYVLHDEMADGLTYRGITEIIHVDASDNSKENKLTAADYTVKTKAGITESTEDDVADDCTFEIVFSNSFCAKQATGDEIIVRYSAVLNEDAVIAGDGNVNESWMTFGRKGEHTTTPHLTRTYTYSIDIVKTDSKQVMLSGAKFKIYSTKTGMDTEVPVVLLKNDDGTNQLDANGNPMYRVAADQSAGVEIELDDGMVTVIGFDKGTYYLEETVAPAGYNKLAERKEFTIDEKNLTAGFENDVYDTGTGVHVVNKAGTKLPETGAKGRTAFIAVGLVVTLITGTLLITKKRMSMTED